MGKNSNPDKCPRCGAKKDDGDWHFDEQANRWERWCTQCGYSESGTT